MFLTFVTCKCWSPHRHCFSSYNNTRLAFPNWSSNLVSVQRWTCHKSLRIPTESSAGQIQHHVHMVICYLKVSKKVLCNPSQLRLPRLAALTWGLYNNNLVGYIPSGSQSHYAIFLNFVMFLESVSLLKCVLCCDLYPHLKETLIFVANFVWKYPITYFSGSKKWIHSCLYLKKKKNTTSVGFNTFPPSGLLIFFLNFPDLQPLSTPFPLHVIHTQLSSPVRDSEFCLSFWTLATPHVKVKVISPQLFISTLS